MPVIKRASRISSTNIGLPLARSATLQIRLFTSPSLKAKDCNSSTNATSLLGVGQGFHGGYAALITCSLSRARRNRRKFAKIIENYRIILKDQHPPQVTGLLCDEWLVGKACFFLFLFSILFFSFLFSLLNSVLFFYPASNEMHKEKGFHMQFACELRRREYEVKKEEGTYKSFQVS